MRNPYKAILSYWNFWNTKSHTRWGFWGQCEHGSWELAVWPTSSVWFLRPALIVLSLVFVLFFIVCVFDPLSPYSVWLLRPALRAKRFKISSPSALRGGLKSLKTGPLLERWPLTFRFWISWWLWWLFAILLRSNLKEVFQELHFIFYEQLRDDPVKIFINKDTWVKI